MSLKSISPEVLIRSIVHPSNTTDMKSCTVLGAYFTQFDGGNRLSRLDDAPAALPRPALCHFHASSPLAARAGG